MSNNSSPRSGGLGVLLCAALFVIVVWGAWFALTIRQWPDDVSGDQLARFGQIGDTFGSLNTLFSGLAIAGVVFTLYRQHQDGREAEARHAAVLDAEERIAKIHALTAVLQDLGNALVALPPDSREGNAYVSYSDERFAIRMKAKQIKLQLQEITGLDLGVKPPED